MYAIRSYYGINDTVAFGLMKAIKDAGLNIPKDIGVVGFTDEFHSTVVDPPLTSVTHPTFEMGKKTAELFFKKLNAEVQAETLILKTNLVVRESSRITSYNVCYTKLLRSCYRTEYTR